MTKNNNNNKKCKKFFLFICGSWRSTNTRIRFWKNTFLNSWHFPQLIELSPLKHQIYVNISSKWVNTWSNTESHYSHLFSPINQNQRQDLKLFETAGSLEVSFSGLSSLIITHFNCSTFRVFVGSLLGNCWQSLLKAVIFQMAAWRESKAAPSHHVLASHWSLHTEYLASTEQLRLPQPH